MIEGALELIHIVICHSQSGIGPAPREVTEAARWNWEYGGVWVKANEQLCLIEGRGSSSTSV